MPLILFLLSLSIFASSDFSTPSYKSLYITDGDSVSLKMRIYGIDTPELAQKCRKTRTKIVNCGEISKNHLEYLLKNTTGRVKFRVVTFDSYKRALVTLTKGKVDIAKQMVQDGFAYAYGSQYKDDENDARHNKRGFWAYHTPPIKPHIWRKNYM
jgi:endonuclease YncB( thermonuclease family)